MKIPKYIDEALHKRTSSACKLLKYDEIVTKFIDKHHIGVDFEDYDGGCEMFLNPYDSEQPSTNSNIHSWRKYWTKL